MEEGPVIQEQTIICLLYHKRISKFEVAHSAGKFRGIGKAKSKIAVNMSHVVVGTVSHG